MISHLPKEFNDLPKYWRTILGFFVKAFVWFLFFLTLYLLRSFSVLVFLTFVFSYIQAHGVHILEPKLKKRWLAVLAVGLLFLSIIAGIGSYLVPQVISQAQLFADNFKSYVSKLDSEILLLTESVPVLKGMISQEDNLSVSNNEKGISGWQPEHSPSLKLLPQIFGFGGEHEGTLDIKQITTVLKNIGTPILAASSSFFLALLFSLLIVLDLPRLSQSVGSLKHSKVRFIYDEVSESIVGFAKTLGAALEAQLFIAILNTILTAFAIYVFGLDKKLAFLSLIVFLGSFIPVAGVFLSSIPMGLLVLEDDGFKGVLLLGLVIWGIHLIEAYVLNPKIFGSRLHINPVLVLMILTLGGKLFGVWGLLLGVPVCTYIFTEAIRYKTKKS